MHFVTFVSFFLLLFSFTFISILVIQLKFDKANFFENFL